jgi:hypothetical protein
MTNRDKLNAILAVYADGTPSQRRLHEECEHHRDIDMEDGPAHPDLAGALPEAEARADEMGDRAVLLAARQAQIAAGYYRVIPDAEAASTQRIGRRQSWFRLGGAAYDWHTRWDRWLEQPADQAQPSRVA